MSEPLVVLVTGPDLEALSTLCRALVEERLCACANLVPGISSIYRWEGRVQEDAEALAILKTTDERWPALAKRVKEIHPYDVPEVLALGVADGSADYLGWMRDSVG